jgi:hypothetical protein
MYDNTVLSNFFTFIEPNQAPPNRVMPSTLAPSGMRCTNAAKTPFGCVLHFVALCILLLVHFHVDHRTRCKVAHSLLLCPYELWRAVNEVDVG